MPRARDAVIERLVATKGGKPIIENQTRLVVLVKDRDGIDPAHYQRFQRLGDHAARLRRVDRPDDAARGHDMVVPREPGVPDARLKYVLFFDQEPVSDPLDQRTVQAFWARVRSANAVLRRATGSRRSGSAPRGKLPIAETFESRSLGGKQRMSFYSRPATRRQRTRSSGHLRPQRRDCIEKMDEPKVLDRLIANKINTAGDRGVLGAERSPGGIFAQPEVARVRRRAGADSRQALRTFATAGPSSDSRRLAGCRQRDRSRGRRAVGSAFVRQSRHRCRPPRSWSDQTDRPCRRDVDQVFRDRRRLRLDDRRRPPATHDARRMPGAGQHLEVSQGHNTDASAATSTMH